MIANGLSMPGRLCRGEGGVDAQVLEERLHADAEIFIVAVDGGPDGGFASSALGAADAGEDGGDDLITQGEQGSDGARGRARDVVAAGSPELGDQAFAAQLPQVISGLAGSVILLSGHGADLGGQVGDGEPGRCRGQGQNRPEGSTDPWLVQVDAAHADLAELGGPRQLIEYAVVDEGGVDAIQR